MPRGLKCCSTMSGASSASTLAKSRDGPPPGGISSTSGVWWHMPTQPTRFTTAGAPLCGQRVLDRPMDLAAALGDAAGAQPDADLAHFAAGGNRSRRPLRRAGLLLSEEILEHLADRRRARGGRR